jgi:hypothetical protein
MNDDQILLERTAMESTVRKAEAHLSLAECELAELTAVLELAHKNERFTELSKLLIESLQTARELKNSLNEGKRRMGSFSEKRIIRMTNEALTMNADNNDFIILSH